MGRAPRHVPHGLLVVDQRGAEGGDPLVRLLGLEPGLHHREGLADALVLGHLGAEGAGEEGRGGEEGRRGGPKETAADGRGARRHGTAPGGMSGTV